MNILCTGDWHKRATRPISRKDNYNTALLNKIMQIYQIAIDHKCKYILQPGDMFDGAEPPLWLIRQAILLHIERTPLVLSVYGQHDQRYHSNKVENTPMAVLEAARVLEVLGAECFAASMKTDIYGCSWDADIPAIETPDNTNILVMHRMVIGNKKLWEAQADYDWGRTILRRNKFDLIVCGDNHHFFTDSIPGDRHLVNCGSLMRANIDQGDHEPAVVIYDTEARTIKTVKLDVAPATDVFDLDKAEAEKNATPNWTPSSNRLDRPAGHPTWTSWGTCTSCHGLKVCRKRWRPWWTRLWKKQPMDNYTVTHKSRSKINGPTICDTIWSPYFKSHPQWGRVTCKICLRQKGTQHG